MGKRGYWITVCCTTLALISIAIFYMSGSVIVFGQTSLIEKAEITNGEQSQKLSRLPSGVFFVFPKLEGSIRVTCHNGVTERKGYATPGLHERLKAVKHETCVHLRYR